MELIFIGVLNLVIGVGIGYLVHKWEKSAKKKRGNYLLERFITDAEEKHEENKKLL